MRIFAFRPGVTDSNLTIVSLSGRGIFDVIGLGRYFQHAGALKTTCKKLTTPCELNCVDVTLWKPSMFLLTQSHKSW